ncbi:hypothetical protein C8R45DRAFT_1107971 [Mycena sanguinolenta]|nr:hypothetical protein C8R45DRAFT_1107971 [Mycena sanguinolenta]
MSGIIQRSSRFYDDGEDTANYPVQHTLYKLDPNAISRSSRYLRDLCRVPGPNLSKQKSSDEAPIVLINAEPAEFEIFVALAYGRPPKVDHWVKGYDSIPPLLRLLELGRYFISPATKEIALSHLKPRSLYLPPAQLIHISFTYGVQFLFGPAFMRLVMMDLRDLTDQHVEWIGLRVYVALARLKEAIQQHRCILATEEPQFRKKTGDESPAHSAACTGYSGCEEDWHCAWWNGMGRFLLDGREPQTWTDSLRRFEDFKFGRMHPDCVKIMFEKVTGAGGYGHIFDMINSVAAQLKGEIVEQVDEDED